MRFLPFFLLIFLLVFAGVSINQVSADSLAPTGGTVIDEAEGNEIPPAGFAGTVKLKNPLDDSVSSIPLFFKAIIDILLIFAIPFIVFFIIYAGFLYVTARGNAETIKKAHNALLYALIGGLLILGANVLLDVITGTVDQIKN